MTPGRNDPCSCGSGKKYKHCCLRAAADSVDSAEALAWRRVRRALDEFAMASTMLPFVAETYGPDAFEEAWEEFSGAQEPFDPKTPHIQVFMPWFFHRWSPDPCSTEVDDTALHERRPTELFLERRGARLDPVIRRYLESCLEAPFSFHEILRCDPGHGFQARDLFTGEERAVLERSATQGMQPGDIVFGQLVTAEGITLLEAASLCFIPPIHKIELIDFRKKLLRGEPRFTPASLCDWDLELIERYLGIIDKVLHPQLPKLHNTDGEPLEMHRLVFDIDSPEKVLDALKSLDVEHSKEELITAMERTARGEFKSVRFNWTKAGNRLHEGWANTIVGHIEIKGQRLVAELNSARRAQEFKTIVEERLGGEARLRADRIQSVEKMLAEHNGVGPEDAARKAESDALAEHPEVQARVQEMMAEHFERWITEKIPALDGQTPLEAVRDPDGREKVMALVIEAERSARRMKPPVDPVTLRRVRERLGLT
ncbi:MAG: SEC-C metal-binding domain-containing protein, partial [Pseudomonadota bacterium]|nr:SEC-C metal-binding domain-containing protein [Pseudomonadota bacterium]